MYSGESVGLEWVNTVILKGTPHKCSARRALRGSRRKHHLEPETTPMVRITASFRLGGFVRLIGPNEEDSNTVLKLVAGIYVTEKVHAPPMNVPAAFACQCSPIAVTSEINLGRVIWVVSMYPHS